VVNKASGVDYYDATCLLFESLSYRGSDTNWEAVRAYLTSGKFDNGSYACFIAYRRGLPIGCVVVERHTEGVAPYYEIHNLYVTPRERGGGAATYLLRNALDWANAAGEDAPLYMTAHGEPRTFFKRLGFEPTHQICVTTIGKVREVLG